MVTAQELVWTATDTTDVPLFEFLGRGFDLDSEHGRLLMLESAATGGRPVPPRIVLVPGLARELLSR